MGNGHQAPGPGIEQAHSGVAYSSLQYEMRRSIVNAVRLNAADCGLSSSIFPIKSRSEVCLLCQMLNETIALLYMSLMRLKAIYKRFLALHPSHRDNGVKVVMTSRYIFETRFVSSQNSIFGVDQIVLSGYSFTRQIKSSLICESETVRWPLLSTQTIILTFCYKIILLIEKKPCSLSGQWPKTPCCQAAVSWFNLWSGN